MPPFSSPHSQVPYPALYLYPLNDSFIPKHISLINNQRVKIGRQTNAKTVPAERNGYFDSKVLSRQHAEVWEESGKIFIKDVKSSNGTFINGERLSPEGLESEPFELKTDDIVEFGIDIVGEDNKTIIHHKVAARVVCVFTEQDAQAAARAEASQNPPTYSGLSGGPGVANGAGSFNFASGTIPSSSNGIAAAQRRSTMQPQGLVGMGGLGGGARPPGKNGLTFDHILNRLQGELQKSRETGSELNSLSSALNEIHDSLGGNIPPSVPPYPQTLPPVVPPQAQPPAEASTSSQATSAKESSAALTDLQAQLHETQRSLASHMEKIRSLENILAEHEAIKREVSVMRDMMEERKREEERARTQSPSHLHQRSHADESTDEYASDDDDARSVSTVVPHELERVDEEDEEQLAVEDEDERRRRGDQIRPRTPEPTGMGIHEDDDEHDSALRTSDSEARKHLRPQSPSLTSSSPAVPDDLAERLTSLSNQLESALELSRSLQAQHTTAQSTISMLESKVTALESLVQATQSQVQSQGETQQQLLQAAEAAREAASEAASSPAPVPEPDHVQERESLTEMLNEWKKSVEGKWSDVQEEWNDERERLRRAKEEWEARMRTVETGFESTVAKVDSGLATLASFRFQQTQRANGSAKVNGLVTPPSPRSLSAESLRPRQKKRRSGSSRGRSRSRSVSHEREEVNGKSLESLSHEHDEDSPVSSRIRRRAPWGEPASDDSSADESEDVGPTDGGVKVVNGEVRKVPSMQYPITPEPSLREQPISSSGAALASAIQEARTKDLPKDIVQHHNLNAQTVLGVLVVVAATGAVLWRMRPET